MGNHLSQPMVHQRCGGCLSAVAVCQWHRLPKFLPRLWVRAYTDGQGQLSGLRKLYFSMSQPGLEHLSGRLQRPFSGRRGLLYAMG